MSELQFAARRRVEYFWAITCYFNPVGYRRRLENYHTFRQHLAVPLVTVELSFDANFQLRHDDADILVQLCGRDVMWQKERLLNVALKSVPDTCEQIAWLDCDVVFESADWPERASQALDHFALVRLFHQRHDLACDAPLDQLRAQDVRPAGDMEYRQIAEGGAVLEDHFPAVAPLEQCRSPGLAWASRRHMIERHGFYDACILGSGDRAILYAALGQFGHAANALRMNNRRLEHYLAWARPFFDSVHGSVGYIRGRLFHLWHGERNDREYRERQRLLVDFDPYRDIAIDGNGCWRWRSSDKLRLHESVRRYFQLRKEDGIRGE